MCVFFFYDLRQVAKLIRLCPQDWEFSVLHFNKINDEKETFRLGQEELNKFSIEDCKKARKEKQKPKKEKEED